MDDVEIDFEAEGLLEGIDDDAREGRVRLLEELADDGVPLEELKAAVEEDRLAMLPVERFYDPPGERYTFAEIADKTGVPERILQRHQRALGMRVPGSDERVLSESDVEMAEMIRKFREAGLPEDGMLEVTRVIGLAMSQIARATSQLTARTVLADAHDERDVAMRFAAAARALTPLANEIHAHAFRLHQLEVLRSEVVGSAEIASGRLAGAQDFTVCFADLVGFTSLGEQLEPDEFGAVTDRLGELAADIAEPPVRLVKLIGDAAMLVSRDTEPLVNAALRLLDAVEEGEDLPGIRVGVARGSALARGGDLYGRAVNLASRLTAIARPGRVLCDEQAKNETEDDFDWSFAGARRIKGIDGSVRLFRARPLE
ncbi:MAG: adenylate cyclase regulatory domain-containing protein [Solirubrobacterales bacterium]